LCQAKVTTTKIFHLPSAKSPNFYVFFGGGKWGQISSIIIGIYVAIKKSILLLLLLLLIIIIIIN